MPPIDLDKIASAVDLDRVTSALSPWSPASPRVDVDYASGSHHEGEILGLADAGVAVGTAAVGELKEAGVRALLRLAGTGTPVFVDSGAFAEVDRGGRVKSRPISDRQWRRKLRLYARLGEALGPQLSVVAPDRVGDQEETLRRLTLYAEPMRRIAALGVRVLVPVQRGAVPAHRFFQRQLEVLGIPRAVPSIPMTAKAGATPSDVADFLRRTGTDEVHLLGMGGRNPRLPAVLRAIDSACPHCRVTVDSNKIQSARVRLGGPGDPTAARPALYYGSGWGDPVRGRDERRLGMIETDRAAAQIEEHAWGGGDLGPDYTDLIGTPSEWLSERERAEVAGWIGLSRAEARAFVDDPDGWLQQDQRYELPWVAGALDRAWTRFYFAQTGVERKRRATRATVQRRRGPGRGQPMVRRVALVSCTDRKLDRPAPARELYEASALFRGARGWVEDQGHPWFVLSARHGAVSPETVLEPYSLRLPSGRSGPARRARLEWAQDVVRQLHEALSGLQGVVFELHAGADYADPLVRLLELQGATVEQPLRGLQIGQRLSWYKQRR